MRGCLVEQGQQTSGNITEKMTPLPQLRILNSSPMRVGPLPHPCWWGHSFLLHGDPWPWRGWHTAVPRRSLIFHQLWASRVNLGWWNVKLLWWRLGKLKLGLKTGVWGSLYILYNPNGKQVLGLEVVVMWFVCVCWYLVVFLKFIFLSFTSWILGFKKIILLVYVSYTQ